METIQYRGAYRFADRETLDAALVVALAGHVEWKPRFSPIESSLRVLLDLPVRSTELRRDADHVMTTLAELALEGIVVARHRELAVDVFMCAIRATTVVGAAVRTAPEPALRAPVSERAAAPVTLAAVAAPDSAARRAPAS